MPEPLAGKTVLVTGASSGIGLAAARMLADKGAIVLGIARRAGPAYPGVSHIVGDLTEAGVIEDAFAAALALRGRLDIVVNNAGYMTSGPLAEIELDRVSRMVRLNVEAAFRIMYLAARHFERQGSGHLVNVSSSVVGKSVQTGGAYAGTKRAIEALAEDLRMQFARSDVRVTNVQPGLVVTELHREYPEPMAKARGFAAPLTPEDVAETILFALTRPAHVRLPTIMIVPGESGQ